MLKYLVGIVTLTLLAGCATPVRRGVVAMKVDGQTAHIGMSSDEVKIGDHVELYENKCSKIGGRGESDVRCVKVSKGHGLITQYFGGDYVEAKFDKGVAFQEGDFIERHAH